MNVAVITGGGSGIGEALARALHARGDIVWILDRDAASAEVVARTLGERARAEYLDVTDASAFVAIAERIRERDGHIDLLFNNAGVGLAGLVHDLSLEDWRRVIDVNLWGVIHGTQAVYPHMRARGRGHIVNIASGAGLAPRPGMAAYAAVKHAVIGLTTSMRAEAAAAGVHVSAACPGYVQTRVLESTSYIGVDKQKLTGGLPLAPMPADECARRILRGVDKNRALIPISAYVTLDWLLYRFFPGLSLVASKLRLAKFTAASNR